MSEGWYRYGDLRSVGTRSSKELLPDCVTQEHVTRAITTGKYADFVRLGKDPRDVDPDTIKNIKVIRTVVGVKTRHE